MAVFAIISLPPHNQEKLGEAVAARYENANLKLSDSAWLVFSTGTAQEISQTLGVQSGQVGSAIVVGVSGYFGRANPNVWAWLKTKMEQPAVDG